MNKRNLLIALLLVVSVATLVLVFYNNKSQKKEVVSEEKPVVVRNDLPNIPLTTIEGDQLSTRSLKGKTILVFFQPDCDHCQRESVEISKHLEDFKPYEMYFISSDNLLAIEKFSKDYKLSGYSNIHFARTDGENVVKNIGPVSTPSVYIYSAEGHLVKSFNGETPIDLILQHL